MITDNIYKGKTVLITGDTGFKGSWLVIWLINLGANVIGYALPPKTKRDNYLICGLDRKINHINADIRNCQKLLSVFSKYKPDIAFHLAAQALVLESYKNPIYTYSTNVMGTINFFEAVRKTSSVKVALNVTSDKCYKNKESVYCYRETDPLGGRDPYSSSKAASEIITSSYIHSFFSRNSTANIASVRAGNVLGGGDWAENRLFPDCMRALLGNKKIVIRNPNCVRPWQHVLEPLSGYLLLGSLLYKRGKEYSGAWNFGPDSRNITSVRQLVEEVVRQWGKGEYIIKNEPNNNSEANFLRLSIAKAIKKLNWHPVLNFKQTIRFAIEEYRTTGLSKEEIYKQRVEHLKGYINFKNSFKEK